MDLRNIRNKQYRKAYWLMRDYLSYYELTAPDGGDFWDWWFS